MDRHAGQPHVIPGLNELAASGASGPVEPRRPEATGANAQRCLEAVGIGPRQPADPLFVQTHFPHAGDLPTTHAGETS
jgi:hypothetical protein